jgi:hypothetical protein
MCVWHDLEDDSWILDIELAMDQLQFSPGPRAVKHEREKLAFYLMKLTAHVDRWHEFTATSMASFKSSPTNFTFFLLQTLYILPFPFPNSHTSNSLMCVSI